MKKLIVCIVLCLFAFIPVVALLQPGLPLSHDGPDHVARIANFYQSLSEGVIVPRWAGKLNWGYGHPILMFLYPLPSYMASIFHGVGFSLVDSVKLVFGLTYVASIATMFLWMVSGWGWAAGIAGALLYGLAPYRFVDLYVRGAIGEHVAFVFPPLILYYILLLARKKHIRVAMIGTAVSMAALILAHNAISLMFMPIIALYIIYLYFFEAKKSSGFLVTSIVSIFTGFLLSAFFWVPAFIEGKYTLRDIVTKGTVENSFSSWANFIYMPWSYGGSTMLSKELGYMQWLGVLGAIILFVRTKIASLKWILGAMLLIVFVSMWLMTRSSAFIWERVSLLQKFQFPWRLLSVSAFMAAVLGSIVVAKVKKMQVVVIGIGLILLIVATHSMWKPSGYSMKPSSYYTDIYNGTTDTGESSPIWSIRFMERRPASWMEVIHGTAEITTASRTSTMHVYKINAAGESRILENTLYFPGWVVRVDGQIVPVEFQDPEYRGLMTFEVAPGNHTVVVAFENTKVRDAANILSVAGIIVLIVAALWLPKL